MKKVVVIGLATLAASWIGTALASNADWIIPGGLIGKSANNKNFLTVKENVASRSISFRGKYALYGSDEYSSDPTITLKISVAHRMPYVEELIPLSGVDNSQGRFITTVYTYEACDVFGKLNHATAVWRVTLDDDTYGGQVSVYRSHAFWISCG